MLLLSVAAFAVVFALPLLPGLLEIIRPRDRKALDVDEGYVRDPHFLGESSRAKIGSYLRETHGPVPFLARFLSRRSEYAYADTRIEVKDGQTERNVLLAEECIVFGDGARVLDAYSAGTMLLGNGVSARTLLCDGPMSLGEDCRIDRWIDARGDITVGHGSVLGSSATTAQRLELAAGVRFGRAFGLPVVTLSGASANTPGHTRTDAEAVADGAVVDGDLIARRDLRIGDGCRIRGSVKAHGALVIGSGSQIEGNVVARADAWIGDSVTIGGHLFCERDLRLGDGTRIGNAVGHKSVYCGKHLELGNDVRIFGWVVTEPLGRAIA